MTLKTKECFFLHFWIRLTSSKNISKILVTNVKFFSQILYTGHFTTQLGRNFCCKLSSVQNLRKKFDSFDQNF